MESPVLNEQQASEYIKMSKAWLRKQRKANNGPKYFKSGKCIRYRVESLDEWIILSERKTQREANYNDTSLDDDFLF